MYSRSDERLLVKEEQFSALDEVEDKSWDKEQKEVPEKSKER